MKKHPVSRNDALIIALALCAYGAVVGYQYGVSRGRQKAWQDKSDSDLRATVRKLSDKVFPEERQTLLEPMPVRIVEES